MPIGKGLSSQLNRRLRIERPVAQSGFMGAGSGTWQLVAEVAANVQDVLPSRGERLADGFTVTNRPTRVRMRYRTDITSDMRFVMGDRVMQIVAGPAELGFRDGIEFMAENWTPAGNTA